MFELRKATAPGRQRLRVAALALPAPGILAIVLLLWLSCGGPPERGQTKQRPAPAATHPRLIYILTIDALRGDLIGLRHGGKPVMPELSAFAGESVYFDHAYSQAPFTKISVASLFTGLWPSRLGVKNCRLRIFPGGVELCRGLDTRFYTLAEDLQARGYHTMTSLFTAHVRKGDGLIQGFAYQEPNLPEELPDSGKTFVYNHVLGLHAPYQPSEAALEYLGVAAGHSEPDLSGTEWFWKPLTEIQGERLFELYLAEGYDWDRWFGEFKRELERSGAWDDALVIVTADHGEEFLEHANTQHSVQLYDEVLRVPLLIKFPAGSALSRRHGSTFSHRVRLVDVFPTLVHFLDRVEPAGFDGESLIPIVEGREQETDRRPALAFTSVARDYDGVPMNFEGQAIVAGGFKAIWGHRVEDSQRAGFQHRRGDAVEKLYDLGQDPGERRDLRLQGSDLFESLRQQYSELSTLPLGTDQVPAMAAESEAERRERERQLKSLGYIQ